MSKINYKVREIIKNTDNPNFQEIATQVGLTRETISVHAKALGIKSKYAKFTRKNIDPNKIKELKDKGYSSSKIAMILNCSVRNINGRLKHFKDKK